VEEQRCILVVDDQQASGGCNAPSRDGPSVVLAEDAESGLSQAMQRLLISLSSTSTCPPERPGVVADLQDRGEDATLIVAHRAGSIETAVEATRAGCFDYP